MRATASDVSVRHYRVSRPEYDRAVEAAAFEPDAQAGVHQRKPERHDAGGQPPCCGGGHRRAPSAAGVRLRALVRVQHPLVVDDYSEAEPDIAIVRGAAHDYLDAHPTAAVLTVEISNESLPYDRTVEQRLYAQCGIPEYWILVAPRGPARGPPRPGWRRLRVRHPRCSRGQGCAARSRCEGGEPGAAGGRFNGCRGASVHADHRRHASGSPTPPTDPAAYTRRPGLQPPRPDRPRQR